MRDLNVLPGVFRMIRFVLLCSSVMIRLVFFLHSEVLGMVRLILFLNSVVIGMVWLRFLLNGEVLLFRAEFFFYYLVLCVWSRLLLNNPVILKIWGDIFIYLMFDNINCYWAHIAIH